MTVPMERVRTHRIAHMWNVQPYVPSTILIGYGVFILSLRLRGVMTWYINPTYVLPTTVAAIVLLGIGAFGVLRAQRQSSVQVGDCCGDDCGCAEPPRHLATYALLALPLALAAIFPPRSLAAFSAHQRGPQIAGASLIHGSAPVSRVSLSVDTRSFSMMDWVGALSADPNPHDYLHKPVRITGMVLTGSGNVPPGTFMVMRYLVTCCIADARPVGLIVQQSAGTIVRDNQWVTVNGTMAIAHVSGQETAVVHPTQTKIIPSQDPYMY